MQTLMNLVVGLQMLAALVMIGLVLIQHGKGADMGASFGSGSAGSLFGATGSANFLSRSTAVAAALFFVCTLALAYFSNSRPAAGPAPTVLDSAAPAASAASAALTGTPAAPLAASAVLAPSAASGVPVPAASSAASKAVVATPVAPASAASK